MTTIPGFPHLLKGAVALTDPVTSAVQQIMDLQYSPDSLTRTLVHRSAPPEPGNMGGAREGVLRMPGPPVETTNPADESHPFKGLARFVTHSVRGVE